MEPSKQTMTPRTLEFEGTVDLNQFWPTGKSPNILSDADTVHVQVDPKSSFVFEGNVTGAFDFAWMTTRKKSTTETPAPARSDGPRSKGTIWLKFSLR